MRILFLFLALFSITDAILGASQTYVEPLTIGRITINRKNVFETGRESDHRFPYSWANKIHIVTREAFIRNELLFQEGDPYDLTLIIEAERHLRSRPLFRYVRITPLEPQNGMVDIEVKTEDVWTTTVQMAYGTAGGETSYTLGFLEHNFLGTGKEIGAFLRKDIDRSLRGVVYKDPQAFGSRWTFSTGYGKDEKGREWETKMEKPFYSTRVSHSEGVAYRNHEDQDRLFENGSEVASFQNKSKDIRVYMAYALSPSPEKIRRITSAFERRGNTFFDLQTTVPLRLPRERVTSAALLGFDFRNIQYHKVRGVRTFDRDEDINLGLEWMVEGGPSLKKWDATNNGAVGHMQMKKTCHLFEDHVWFKHLDLEGRLESGTVQNGIFRLRSHYFVTQWIPRNVASLRAEFISSKNLDPERQFLLGGENGLRGYSVRQFSGQHKWSAALENRHDLVYDWLHLVSIGWAAFVDTGAAWKTSEGLSLSNVKSDIGLGLRFAPSRSFDPGLIRVDVAYALQDNNKDSRFVLNIGADLTFGERRKSKFEN